MRRSHRERHRTQHVGWLRAAVLGANDGIVSTASLVLGVAAANVSQQNVLVAGIAGLVAGAMSMAAGEYVSVHSQADAEKADIETDDASEHKELAAIYQGRGLDAALAVQVAEQLMAHDALGAHLRDELGISRQTQARPIQAALASATSFAIGAAFPLTIAAVSPAHILSPLVGGTSLVCLAALGAMAARAGGAPKAIAAIRVTFWSALAMGLTAAVGALFGVSA